MTDIMPKDVLLRVGGRTLQRFGVIGVGGARRGHGAYRPIETFSRADGTTPLATSFDRDGVLRVTAQNLFRIDMMDLDGDGVREAATLVVERAVFNDYLRSEEFDNAAWAKTNCTITANQFLSPDGTTSVDRWVESTDGAPAIHNLSQTLPALTDNTTSTASIYVAADFRSWLLIEAQAKNAAFYDASFQLTGAGVIGTVSANAKATITRLVLSDGSVFYRCSITFPSNSGGTTPNVKYYPATGDGGAAATYQGAGLNALRIWGAQFEKDKRQPTSYIKTVSTTMGRAADAFTVPVNFGLIPLTLYADFVERELFEAGTDNRVMTISSINFTGPYVGIQALAGANFRGIYDTGSSGVIASGNLSCGAWGDRTRICLRLFADGSVEIERRLNNGAASTSSRSSASFLFQRAGWSAQTLHLNGGNGTEPSKQIKHYVDAMVFRGNFALAECEAVP